MDHRPEGPRLPDWTASRRHRDRGRYDPDGCPLTKSPDAWSKCAHQAHRAHKTGAITKITTTMAKMYGLFGSMKGKVADVVMSVRNGNQIVRKYQPMVYNPSTAGQVAARAKLKLISQLSASMGSVIAIPREGIVSPRNLFTKVNFPAVSFIDSADPQVASVDLSAIKITKSSVYLPNLTATVADSNATIALASSSTDIDRMVYNIFTVTSTNELRRFTSVVVSEGPTFSTTVAYNPALKYVVYAYGIRLNSDAARARFDNMTVGSATLVASLITSRVLTESDITLTETRFADVNP